MEFFKQPKQPKWKIVEYSKNQIKKAGKIIKHLDSTSEQMEEATKIIDNWRAAHAFPLHVIYTHLRRMALINKRIVVAERLKRLDSIINKLKREKTMSLLTMQDLGGCRFIVPRIKDVYKYHFIYVQINFRTGEYYIGKVNRKRWKELKNYKGSGLLFQKKYKKHTEEFVQYFIACCKTAEETEKLEAQIVNSELLKDPLCLNLVKGGGGTSKHDSEERIIHIREYLLAHPEQYQAMLAKNKELYCSGPTPALKARNERIKATASQSKYREMSRKRIIRWKTEHPEEYAASRENNRIAMQSEESKQKRNASLQKWREAHPKEYAEYRRKQIEAAHSAEAKAKRSKSLKEWNRTHPEEVKRRAAKVGKSRQKAVNMLDLKTGEVLKSFNSQQEAAEWLVQQGLAKNTKCKGSISAVCLKKLIPGHGTRNQAHGYGWEFKEEK